VSLIDESFIQQMPHLHLLIFLNTQGDMGVSERGLNHARSTVTVTVSQNENKQAYE